MGLTPGVQLGPYQIVSSLGAGGMGEVYRARDSRLGRDVAVKILPAQVAADPARRQRFEQEARAVAALNHPSIMSVFDIGETGGIAYMVTELIDGQAFRHGTFGQRKIIELAAQVAEGLAAAHRAGITHRDLKPDNIMVTADGRAKILDFGLAKVIQPLNEEDETAIMSHTQAGMIMGTLGYMSPEQVRGRPVDGRSDIFSFGLIVYERIAGRHPFIRESSAEVMAAIVRDEPDELPPSVSSGLADIIRHCLEKDPAHRFQSAQDLAFQLRALANALSSGSGTTVPAPAVRARWWPSRKQLLATGIALLAIWGATATTMLFRSTDMDHESYRFTPFVAAAQPASEAVWSPDGRALAFTMAVGRQRQIFTRPMDSSQTHQVTRGANGAANPAWSADGSFLYYISEDKLWSMGLAGGEPDLVLPNMNAAAISPDGKTLAFMRTAPKDGVDITSIWVSSPPEASPVEYLPPAISHPGRLGGTRFAFSRDGSQLVASCVTPHGMEVFVLPFPMGSGKPRRLFQSVLAGVRQPPSFSWMPDNRHAVMSLATSKLHNSQLWMADLKDGTLKRITADSGNQEAPAVSPDGKRLVFAVSESDFNVVSLPLDGGPPVNLLATSRSEHSPAYSPGGDEYAYVTDRSGEAGIWVRNLRTGTDRELVTPKSFGLDMPNQFEGLEFSSDGQSIVFGAVGGNNLSSIWIVPAAGGTPVRLTKSDTEGFEANPTWSPDGNWVAYATSMHGRPILRMSRVGSQDTPRNLADGMCEARWSPKRDWIICGATPDGFKVVAADGSTVKMLPRVFDVASAWSADGSTIYGLTLIPTGTQLAALDFRTGKVRNIRDFGLELQFESSLPHAVRLSLSKDGKSVATTTVWKKSDLWMMEGFPQPRRWFGR
jgi:Tol biopolymer transport system component